MTAYRHIIFRITIVAFLAAFLTFIPGCGGDDTSIGCFGDEDEGASGYRALKSEGHDEATHLWKEIVHEKSGIVLRLVPAGEFSMGSQISPEEVARKYEGEAEDYKDEHPLHKVKISEPFYIGKYEVTNEQLCKFLNAKAAHSGGGNIWVDLEATYFDEDCRIEKRGGKYRPKSGYAGHPATMVSWYGAKAFCEWVGGRLPSEVEWEYACRAGSKTRWCFGNNESILGEYAWYKDNSGDKPHEVGKKTPNAGGVYDMHGNVGEWCENVWHNNYNGAPNDGSAWTTGGNQSLRVHRGGSWVGVARVIRSAVRFWHDPGVTYYYVGFRVVVAAGAAR